MADDRGELCGRLLADLGADVILVEPPEGGAARSAPPWAPDGRSSLYFAFRNAGKRGITLDLSRQDGRDRLHALLADADIWIEAYAPGHLGALDLAPERVLERHPSLILTSITDFGQTGPHRDFAGTDMIGYAMGGMLYRAGSPERPPVVAPGCQAYDTAAVTAAFATLLAILRREQSGRGQWIDVSVQEATSNLADWSVPIYSVMKFFTHRAGAGMYPLYRCADGWLRLIILSPHHWRSLREWMGDPEALRDPALAEFINRFARQAEIDTLIQQFLAGMEKQRAAHEAQSRGIPATPVLEPAEVLENEHTRARGSFVEFELLPRQRAKVASGFLELDGLRVGPRARAPSLGEHNREVLNDALLARSAQGSDAKASPSMRESRDDGGSLCPPLAGRRVVDFGVGVAGVEVGRLFAEYGAEVIKVETGKAPDFIRIVMPGDMNPPFTSSNRCKLSFGLNLKHPTGRELAYRLIREADVVIENSATGVMDRLGLGYERLKEINPRIIMFSSQMLGSSGPWKDWIGYGPNTHPVSGLQYLWNYPEDAERPAGSTNIHPDHLVGRVGALGVLAAMIRRAGEGRGAHVEVAQFEVIIQLLGDLFAAESLQPGSLGPRGNASDRGAPWGVYPCLGEDEWCVINVRSDREWECLCEALGRPRWASQRRFERASERREAREEIDRRLAEWTGSRRPDEVMRTLQAHGVAAGIVAHAQHQLEDPHLAARGFFQKLDQIALGEVVLEGPGFRGSDLPLPRVAPAPLLGQHTRALCSSLLGLSPGEIASLFEQGVLEESAPSEAKR
jgi:crotonobetainyl-CoA:carnitine CoA-transferase CaiB-like acyl-CoA transferase